MQINTKIFIQAFIILSSSFSFAQINGGMSGAYMKKLIIDNQAVIDLNTNFKNNQKSFCPKYRGSSATFCMKEYISVLTVKSSTQILQTSVVVLSVILRDKAEGHISKEDSKIQMADITLNLFDREQLSNFHLAELKPSTDTEKIELQMLRKDDEVLLTKLCQKMNDTLSKSLNELASSRNIASDGTSVAGSVERLKSSLNALTSRKWSYSY